jgi:chemotaxis protein MotA
MDIASIIGLGAGLTLLLIGILNAGLGFGDIFDIASIMITFGGATSATVMATPLVITNRILNVSKKVFYEDKFDVPGLITTLVSFSEKARREGLLALEDDVNELSEEFLKKGIQLVVDGTDPELVRSIMQTEMDNIAMRHGANREWWDTFSSLSPAFGMLGTLIGLIAMLQNLGNGDASAIGQGMATALITTLYGSFGANMIAIPVFKKLLKKSEQELAMKQIMIEGTLSIQSGDNPRIVKEKLSSYLPPSERGALKDGD